MAENPHPDQTEKVGDSNSSVSNAADHGYSPLDPKEGPTVWAQQVEANKHTVEIVTGTDPTDPTDTYKLSHSEISRLAAMVDDD
jgi:hypothetical protein